MLLLPLLKRSPCSLLLLLHPQMKNPRKQSSSAPAPTFPQLSPLVSAAPRVSPAVTTSSRAVTFPQLSPPVSAAPRSAVEVSLLAAKTSSPATVTSPPELPTSASPSVPFQLDCLPGSCQLLLQTLTPETQFLLPLLQQLLFPLKLLQYPLVFLKVQKQLMVLCSQLPSFSFQL